MIVLLLIAIVGIIYIGLQIIQAKKEDQEWKIRNQKIKEDSEKLFEQYNKLIKQSANAKAELSAINDSIKQHNTTLSNLKNIEKEMQESSDQRAQEYYNDKIKQAELKYQEFVKSYEKNLNLKKQEVEIEQQKLKELEDKQKAYIEAQKRKEVIAMNKDYYRLAIDKVSLQDIADLRRFQRSFSKKEIIDKVIYEGYYRPLYNVLMSHLFGDKTKVSCIYKLTDQITEQIYIGQSQDARERLKTHVKTALSSNAATNKLYQAMKKDGIHNFTFEILEEVPREKLNEREMYWIEFYHAKDQLNSTKGGA